MSDLEQCVRSVLSQDYEQFEVVVITEGESVTEHVTELFDGTNAVRVKQISNNDGGLSVARNAGAEISTGDVVTFVDDDAVAENGWLQSLGKVYRDKDVLAVGGRATPDWRSTRPWYLAEEFLWLVGSTHRTHPESGSMVRNTFGCNISYDRDVFLELDGFSEELGKTRSVNLQGEEPEFGLRLLDTYDTGVYYEESANVEHKVDEYQTTFGWLSKRAFWQGYSKAVIQDGQSGDALDNEYGFLAKLLKQSIPRYLKQLGSGDIASAGHLFGVLLFTMLVGSGFVYGMVRSLFQ